MWVVADWKNTRCVFLTINSAHLRAEGRAVKNTRCTHLNSLSLLPAEGKGFDSSRQLVPTFPGRSSCCCVSGFVVVFCTLSSSHTSCSFASIQLNACYVAKRGYTRAVCSGALCVNYPICELDKTTTRSAGENGKPDGELMSVSRFGSRWFKWAMMLALSPRENLCFGVSQRDGSLGQSSGSVVKGIDSSGHCLRVQRMQNSSTGIWTLSLTVSGSEP